MEIAEIVFSPQIFTHGKPPQRKAPLTGGFPRWHRAHIPSAVFYYTFCCSARLSMALRTADLNGTLQYAVLAVTLTEKPVKS